MEEKWLSIKQVAERLGKSVQTIMDYCNGGNFPHAAKADGERWVIPQSDVEAFMAGKQDIAKRIEYEALRGKVKDVAEIMEKALYSLTTPIINKETLEYKCPGCHKMDDVKRTARFEIPRLKDCPPDFSW